MILLSYSNSSIKGTEILGSVIEKFSILYLFFYDRPFLHVRYLEEDLLFSRLILGSVFSDYVVFYGDIPIAYAVACLVLFHKNNQAGVGSVQTVRPNLLKIIFSGSSK